MSTVIRGQVERVVETPTKFGSLFGFFVDGKRYGAGKSANGVSPGDWVEFSVTQNEKGYLDIDKGSIKPVPAPSGATSPSSVKASAPTTPYVDTRQDSIVYQSSRKDALHFIQVLMDGGLVDFGKAKNADKIAILETYLDKYTEHFISEVKANKTSSLAADTVKEENVRALENDELPF